jgi:membrane fusion protein (multidrug efflux system)
MELKARFVCRPLWPIVVLSLLGGCESAPDIVPAIVPPLGVRTVLPRTGEISRSVTLPTFRILPYQQATLYAKVSGYLKSLEVDKGDAVTEGQLLAEIEVPELLADEAQFQAETEVARLNHERVAKARQRAPDLVVPQTVDDLRGQWDVARARLQRTRALLQYARINAPFSGVITARFVDPGAFIPAATAGTPVQNTALVTLMDFSRLRVQVYVPEMEVPFIKAGVPVRVRIEELQGRTFSGSVTRFAYALDEATKTMLTEVELPNPGRDLRPGMYASVEIEVERKTDALLLPAAAVLTEKAGSFVFLVLDGKAKRVPVRTGWRDASNVEILEGVAAGQPVIVADKQPPTDGQSVVTAEAK